MAIKSLLEAIEIYSAMGWKLHPVNPMTKTPFTSHGFLDATDNMEQLEEWWSRWPNASIGLSLPDTISVVDLDDIDALPLGSRFDLPEFDLYTRRVDIIGGFQDTKRRGKDPQGPRWAFMDWDFPGLKVAVRVDGTLNDPKDVDKGWTAEIAFPWSGMKTLAGSRPVPPRDGDVWRMDFSRFELLEFCGAQAEPHPGWALNRHGVYNSHIPECFSFVHLSSATAGE